MYMYLYTFMDDLKVHCECILQQTHASRIKVTCHWIKQHIYLPDVSYLFVLPITSCIHCIQQGQTFNKKLIHIYSCLVYMLWCEEGICYFLTFYWSFITSVNTFILKLTSRKASVDWLLLCIFVSIHTELFLYRCTLHFIYDELHRKLFLCILCQIYHNHYYW